MLTVLILLLASAVAWAVVNPALQPSHLVEGYQTVLALRVAKIDPKGKSVSLQVIKLLKGTFAPKSVQVAVASPDLEQVVNELEDGQLIVAFVGKDQKRREKDLLLYLGAGRWEVGQVEDLKDLSRWQWTKDLGDEMYGTFTGGVDRLAELLDDMKKGTAYFPPLPYVQFGPDIVIGKFTKPVRGVALYDIDGDGKLDIYACCETGNKMYLQRDRMKFIDATADLKLDGIAGLSCSFADVNADGKPDLLADGVIYLHGADGKFTRSDLLPPEASRQVKSSAFVDFNGDGYPDVVLSRTGGGLAVYLNPGRKGGPFNHATAACGLDRKECGAGLTGYFAPGDWNDDGRIDLFYAAGKGLLLIQGADGKFSPLNHRVSFDFESGSDGLAGKTGAGVFAPIWRPDRLSLIVPAHSELQLAAEIDGKLTDVTGLGNEISEATYKQLGTTAEDLNADGYVDFYTTSWHAGTPNTFHMNRGYGSFMRPDKYKRIFGARAHLGGAWGVAAGDVNGDGAVDLLIGGIDGTLTLMLNETLTLRKPMENPVYHEKKQQDIKLLSVRLTGPLGILGAKVTLTDAEGRVVARRDIGSNVSVGSCGPASLALAIREPGKHTLTVRYSDGATQTWPVDLTRESHVKLVAGRK